MNTEAYQEGFLEKLAEGLYEHPSFGAKLRFAAPMALAGASLGGALGQTEKDKLSPVGALLGALLGGGGGYAAADPLLRQEVQEDEEGTYAEPSIADYITAVGPAALGGGGLGLAAGGQLDHPGLGAALGALLGGGAGYFATPHIFKQRFGPA